MDYGAHLQTVCTRTKPSLTVENRLSIFTKELQCHFSHGRMVQSSECSALALAVPCSASLIPLPESLVWFPLFNALLALLPYQCCVNLPSLVYQDVHLLPVHSATGAEVTDRQREVRLLPP